MRHPVAYLKDGERYVVIASNSGDAQVAEEPERTRLYNKMVEMLPAFDDYRRRAARDPGDRADAYEVRLMRLYFKTKGGLRHQCHD